MKRYLLFAFDDYYPKGGWNDFAGDFGNLDDAIAAARAAVTIASGDDFPSDNAAVIDAETGALSFQIAGAYSTEHRSR